MDAVTAACSTFNHAVQKDHIVVVFLNSNVPVTGVLQRLSQVCKLVVMSREHRATLRFIVKMLGDTPRQTDAVVGTCSSTDFIQDDNATVCCAIKNASRLCHLHHERTLAFAQFVACSDSSENAISDSNASFAGGDKRSHLGHDRQQSCLPNISTLTGHVWPGDQLNSTGGAFRERRGASPRFVCGSCVASTCCVVGVFTGG